eukprot:4094192-Amphidinium_carterae.2
MAMIETANKVFMIGPHLCIITAGRNRLACRNCKGYVSTYQKTWRNLGTLKKQPCKPKTKKQARSKAPHCPQQQKGGPRGTLKKGRTHASPEQETQAY